MDAKRMVGRNAGVQKYDVLTALATAGLHGSPTLQTSMLRLVALITARYNWRYDELSVGQREMARLWGVNERTVKREIKRLCDGGFLICKRRGVKGRVGAYSLNFAAIYQSSTNLWSAIGPDFEDRMSNHLPDPESKVVKVDFRQTEPDPMSGSTSKGWPAVMARLRSQHASAYANWYAHLTRESWSEGVLVLKASSGFVAGYIETHLAQDLLHAAEQELGPIERIVLSA